MQIFDKEVKMLNSNQNTVAALVQPPLISNSACAVRGDGTG
jgi:hypothetical protein